MGFISFVSYLLIAYGPAITIFILYISKSAQLVILLVSSAFFWLISILISSIYWYIIVAIYNAVNKNAPENADIESSDMANLRYLISLLSVATQELFRWLFWKLLSRAENGLNAMSDKPKSPLNKYHFSFASGLGFGFMSGLVSYSTILSESLNPGTLICSACPSYPMPFIAAIITSLFILMHIVWSLIAFEAFDKKQKLLILWVFISHFGASLATSLTYTTNIKFACLYCLLILFTLLFISSFISFKKFTKLKAL